MEIYREKKAKFTAGKKWILLSISHKNNCGTYLGKKKTDLTQKK